jgi:biopolymer transport protein ExbD
MRLPTSIAEKAPKETIVIAITPKDILVQGRSVARIDQILASKDDVIIGLKKELEFQSRKGTLTKQPEKKKGGFAVTIMGDENLPYELLRKVLASCRQANYTKIAFAAMQKPKNKA